MPVRRRIVVFCCVLTMPWLGFACSGELSPADGPRPRGDGPAAVDGTTGPRAERGSVLTEQGVFLTEQGAILKDHGPTVDGPKTPKPDGGGCPAVTVAPTVDAWTMRAPSAGFGGISTQASGGHTDVFLTSPGGLTRIGARLDWGGTVVFFGLAANAASNVIDANDTGRELQLAIYDPARSRQSCAYNASCVTSSANCGNLITFLGWNPVQGGDECGRGAKVLSQGQVGDALRLTVQPLQWNPDWNAPDCRKSSCSSTAGVPVAVTYAFEFRFVSEHVVEVASEVSSQETISHDPMVQEFPTLYVSHGKGGPDLPVLLDASGGTVNIATLGNDGFFYTNFSSAAPWVTWQNAAQSYGVGLAMDQGIQQFQAWRGDGTTAPYFHNVRAQISFGLSAGGTVRGVSYLALGNFATVKAELEGILAKRAPFGVIDVPATGDVTVSAGQSLALSGWVLDTGAVGQVKVLVDGQQVGTIPVNSSRPDVCAVYPAYGNCPKPGYSGNITVPGLGGCPRRLQVVAQDGNGNSRVLGERRLVPK